MPYPISDDPAVSTCEGNFVSGEANYSLDTTEAGNYVVLAVAPFEGTKYIGTPGSATGEMPAINWTPFTFEVSGPLNLIAPTFEMHTLTGAK